MDSPFIIIRCCYVILKLSLTVTVTVTVTPEGVLLKVWGIYVGDP
jgi:hypothetical protein